jgi:hypothetical protein
MRVLPPSGLPQQVLPQRDSFPPGLYSLRLASLWDFAHRACSQYLPPPFRGTAFTGSETPGLLQPQVRSLRPREDRDCPRGAGSPTGQGHSQGLRPLRTPPVNAPTSALSRAFSPWGFTTQSLSQHAFSLGPRPQRLLLQGLCPTGLLTLTLPTGSGQP